MSETECPECGVSALVFGLEGVECLECGAEPHEPDWDEMAEARIENAGLDDPGKDVW